MVAFVGVVLFGGLNAIAVRQTVLELAPLWSAALRFVAAGVGLMAIVAATRRPLPGGAAFRGAMLYGAFGFSASFALIYHAIRDMSAGTAQVIIALTPLMTFGLAIAQGQERFRLSGLVGGLVAVAGIAIVMVDQLSIDVPIQSLLLVVGGTVFIAESTVVAKRIPRADPIATNAVAMLTGGGLLLTASFVVGETHAVPGQSATWIALGYLVTLGSILMFGLYLLAIQRWTASAVSYTTLLLPLVTVTVGALLTGERVSPALVGGAAVIVVGVYLGAFRQTRGERMPARSPALPECLPPSGEAELTEASPVEA